MSKNQTTHPTISKVALVGVATLLVTAAAASVQPAHAAIASSDNRARHHVPPTIAVGSNPAEIAVSPNKAEAYVLNDGSVSVINTRSNEQVAEVGTGFHDQTAIGLVRGGGAAYIGTFDQSVVKVFSTKSRKVVGDIHLGRGATGVATERTKSGEYAYVSLLTAKRIGVVATKTDSVVKRIKLPRGPQTITRAPGGRYLWAGSSYSGRIWVIDSATQKVVRRVTVQDSGPVSSIAFSPNGHRAWVSGLGGVSIVNVTSGKVLGFLPAPKLFPHTANLNLGELALNTRGTAALVVNSTYPDSPARGSVAVVGTKAFKVRRHINLGTEPNGIAVDHRRGTTYVTNYLDDTVSYFNTPK